MQITSHWHETKDQAASNLYLTFKTAQDVLQHATISRATRDHKGNLTGFQRIPIQRHIANIASYLRTPGAKLQNPLIIGIIGNDTSQAMVVDGQQRLLACQVADYKELLPIIIFRAESIVQLRLEFLRINNVQPIPKALMSEILSDIGPSQALSDGGLALKLVEKLNSHNDSPLKGKIKRETNPAGVIRDTALIRAVRQSLAYGMLSQFKAQPDAIMEAGFLILVEFYSAVSAVFKSDWDGQTPTTSRLVHGTGIYAITHAMDVIQITRGATQEQQFAGPLLILKPYCAWRTGHWSFADGTTLNHNDIENLPAHRAKLAMHIELLIHASAT